MHYRGSSIEAYDFRFGLGQKCGPLGHERAPAGEEVTPEVGPLDASAISRGFPVSAHQSLKADRKP